MAADMAGPGEPEVLQQGREPRPRGPRALAVRLSVGVLVVALVGAVLGVDHRVREGESRRVSGCAREAVGAVRFSSTRVDAILGYVRPTLESSVPEPLRRRLLRTVSIAVAPTVPGVRAARDRCTRVRVLPVHGRLQGVRDDCLRLLDRDLTYLRGVVDDGARAQLTRSLPAGTCHERAG